MFENLKVAFRERIESQYSEKSRSQTSWRKNRTLLTSLNIKRVKSPDGKEPELKSIQESPEMPSPKKTPKEESAGGTVSVGRNKKDAGIKKHQTVTSQDKHKSSTIESKANTVKANAKSPVKAKPTLDSQQNNTLKVEKPNDKYIAYKNSPKIPNAKSNVSSPSKKTEVKFVNRSQAKPTENKVTEKKEPVKKEPAKPARSPSPMKINP